MNLLNSILNIIELSHLRKPNHYFTIRGYRICARCFGFLFGFLFTFPFFRLLSLNLDFLIIFVPSTILASICFANWVIGRLYIVSNESRFVSGILLGIALSYFSLLPNSRLFALEIMLLVGILMLIVISFSYLKKESFVNAQ